MSKRKSNVLKFSNRSFLENIFKIDLLERNHQKTYCLGSAILA